MEKVNARKVFLVIIIILILLVIALFIGKFTFSYLAPDVGEDASNKGEVTASGDTIIFNTGKALSLSATADNFTTGGTNLTDTSNPTAKLVASSKTNKADATYYVGVYIKNNTYTYSTTDKTPEVLLTIKDEKGNNVTSVDGLTYATSGGVSGFDITDKSGLFNVKTDYPISTTSSSTGTTHTWTFTLTFVNLSTDQSVNENANMNIDVYLQTKTFLSTVADVCSGGETLASCITSLSQKSISQATNNYYHDSNLANGAGDNSYRYAGGDYVLTEAGKATGATMMIGYSSSVTTALIDFYCNGTKQYVGYNCNASQAHYYLIKGDTTQYQTYKETLNKAVEKGYLTKDNVKNFVCFGSTASPCPTENLYRIIGVFGNNVKLIKWDYAKSSLLGTDGDFSQESSYYSSGEQGENPASNSLYYWNNSTQTNTWSESNLNKVNLNKNFINNIRSEWAAKISETTWKVGGNTRDNIVKVTPSVAYQNEIVNPVTTNTTDSKTEYKAKVGLMYVSDYGYAASPSAWTFVGYNSDYSKSYASAKGENWLYGGGWDWTISRYADRSDRAFGVDDYGNVDDLYVSYNRGVRPSFNLESAITYVSGSGSASDPMVIN